MSQRIGIVGGGLLGLNLADRLQNRGHSVSVFEAAPEFGGLASAWRLGDITWDRFYHVILLSDTFTHDWLKQLNLDSEFVGVQTKTGFYTDGRLHSMSNSWEFLKFPPLGLWSKFRLGRTIQRAAKITDWKELERIPVEDWLRKMSGDRTTQKIWLPLLRAKLGESYRDASAAFIWATIARMYAARRSGMKKELFGYVRGGYGRILDQYTEQLQKRGIELVTNAPVKEIGDGTGLQPSQSLLGGTGILPVDGFKDFEDESAPIAFAPGERSIAISKQSPHRQDAGATQEKTHRPAIGGPRIQFATGEVREFDRVIVTAAPPLATRLVPGLPSNERERWNALKYQGIVCASLVLSRPLSPFYVTNLTDDWVPFTAVIEMTALVDPEEFGGRHLVYLPKYVAPDDPLFQESDASIRERFLSALQRIHPKLERGEVLEFKIARVKHVFAVPTLHYSEQVPPMQTGVPGVVFVNSAHIINGTLNVNETLQLAARAAEELA